MPSSKPGLDELIVSVHSAALAPDGWEKMGKALLNVLSANKGIGLRISSEEYPEPWAMLLDFEPSAAALYARAWAPYDVWYHGAVRTQRLTTGLVSVGNQLVDDRDFKSSPFFVDYLKPLDIGQMIQVCLAGIEPDGSIGERAALSLYRGLNGEPFSSQDAELLGMLAPHLAIAAKNYWTAHTLRLFSQAQQHALDTVASGVFAINQGGRLLFVNRTGEEMLRGPTWVRLARGKLSPVPSLLILDRLEQALGRLYQGWGATLLVTDRITGAEAHVSMSPIPATIDLVNRLATPSSLVWITPVTPRRTVGEDLAKLFELTPAERRIVDKLVAGDDLRAVATSLEISINTARTQLKSIFRKTGRRSQSELMLLVARIAAIYPTRS